MFLEFLINVFLQALYYRIDCSVRLQDRLFCLLTGSTVVYALIIHDYAEKKLKSLEHLD
jgi:hypothetical protein